MSSTLATLEKIATGFSGLWVLQPRLFQDHRGMFVKTYHQPTFCELGIPFEPKEEFYSVSRANVIRGMHFQLPPMAHAKLVYCVCGQALDVVLDLRKTSATCGRSFSAPLDALNRSMLFIPTGFAHGFLALQENTTLVYKTDAVHEPELDCGIAWDSFGFLWPALEPLLSQRDRGFPAWGDFRSPF